MKIQDLREMDEGRLQGQLASLQAEYLKLAEDVRSGKEQNHAQLAVLKKNMARIKTVMNEKLHFNKDSA